MGRRGKWLVTVAVAAAGMLSSTPVSAASFDQGAERAFVSLINRERAARGLRPLEIRADLVALARRHTREMVAADRLYHNYRLFSQVRPRRYATGENVGVGVSVSELHSQFMASSSHRRNVLFSIFSEVGVGVMVHSSGWMYVTIDFARPYASAPRTTAPAPVTEPPRTVELLLRLASLDAS